MWFVSQFVHGRRRTYRYFNSWFRIDAGNLKGNSIYIRNKYNLSDAKQAEKPSTTWERGAISVKNVDVTNPYLETIRKTHDPAMQIKTLEDELKGAIGQALGKQGRKVLMWMKVMEQEREKYESLKSDLGPSSHRDEVAVVKAYNDARDKALHARWELVVHRQAAGFLVGNHKYVHEMFPIAEKLVASQTDKSHDTCSKTNDEELKGNQFGDQLDWWQKIGRWR